MNKAVVFTCNLGEFFNINIFKNLTFEERDVFLVVNDIDFARKVDFYNEAGIIMIQRLYRVTGGNFCSSKSCSWAPKELSVIDESDYIFTKEFLPREIGLVELKELLRLEIIPKIIKNKCDSMGLKPKKIFTETYLRNRAFELSKKMVKQTGEDVFLKNGMRNEKGFPLCKGILSTFNKILSESGYDHVEYIIPHSEESTFIGSIQPTQDVLNIKIEINVTLY